MQAAKFLVSMAVTTALVAAFGCSSMKSESSRSTVSSAPATTTQETVAVTTENAGGANNDAANLSMKSSAPGNESVAVSEPAPAPQPAPVERVAKADRG